MGSGVFTSLEVAKRLGLKVKQDKGWSKAVNTEAMPIHGVVRCADIAIGDWSGVDGTDERGRKMKPLVWKSQAQKKESLAAVQLREEHGKGKDVEIASPNASSISKEQKWSYADIVRGSIIMPWVGKNVTDGLLERRKECKWFVALVFIEKEGKEGTGRF
ncbi:hypothetical protein CKAN_02010500 [Cinnamomum micranthum f. kanehirae]|uniref:Uncharacterized protein n=1 Tax=Cinnamomum micranthum f. kanehirae TaxID=337451 RepID=A0A3S4PIK7_9MAGN|nr:hypothetical protein CKAN_02010500 [Cinnamomum micranthum f. kanehirae]